MLTIQDKTFVPFIDHAAIQRRIAQLADQINLDYKDKQPLLVVVLNGAALFAADLFKELTIPCEITFIRVASYAATESTGQVKEILGLNESLRGRALIVVEDIVDTGLTVAEVCRQLRAHAPASVAVATLLFKPAALKEPLDLHYVGFEIENRFVLGYGLDYDGLGRNTKDILVLQDNASATTLPPATTTGRRQRLAQVTLLVHDYDEAKAFFCEKLCFNVVEDTALSGTKRWVLLTPPGATTLGCGLLLAKATTADQQRAVGNQTGGRVAFFLHTDNFQRDYADMRAKGVRFVEEPRHELYGNVVVFEDLYGNRWDLIEPRDVTT